MAGNGALDLSIRIMGKVDPSLVTAIKQTKGLTGDLTNALTGTKSLGSTVANTLGVIGKTGLGIMATLTTASAVMIKKTTSMAEEYQAQSADAVKYVGGIMNDDGSIDPEKRATMEDAILKMTTQVPIKRDEMAQIAASLGQSGKSYEQIFLDNQQTGEKSYLYDTARLAAAWDIDAKSAADYMAKWETAFGKTHNQIIDIADSINYLGGHMATTAAEIASVVNTSGGVGQTAGVDLHTTSALAATMLAMGVNEGKAGTSLNRVFTNITLGNSATDAQVAHGTNSVLILCRLQRICSPPGRTEKMVQQALCTKSLRRSRNRTSTSRLRPSRHCLDSGPLRAFQKLWATCLRSRMPCLWLVIPAHTAAAWRKNCLFVWTPAKR